MTIMRLVPLAALLLSACGGSQPMPVTEAKAEPTAADPNRPTVVELFQSQGCSSCPPAIANVNAIADRPGILALTFAVTYWDRLGWKDTFGDPAYTDRQWKYARAGGRPNVFTPQVIVNGRTSIVGARPDQLEQALRTTPAIAAGPRIDAEPGKAVVRAGRAATPATVWLVRFDPRAQQVAIGGGENGGRTIAHRNVVRQLVRLGRWTGAEARFPLPAPVANNLAGAVLVQGGEAGPIIAARRL